MNIKCKIIKMICNNEYAPLPRIIQTDVVVRPGEKGAMGSDSKIISNSDSKIIFNNRLENLRQQYYSYMNNYQNILHRHIMERKYKIEHLKEGESKHSEYSNYLKIEKAALEQITLFILLCDGKYKLIDKLLLKYPNILDILQKTLDIIYKKATKVI